MASEVSYTGRLPSQDGGWELRQTGVVPAQGSVLDEPVFLRSIVSGAPVWPSFTLANGTVGIAYNQSWDLSPALSPTTYTLVSGSLPTGLLLSNISGDIGQITGTPTAAGTYPFTLRATNSLGTSDKSFTVTIGTAVSGGAFTFVN